MSAAHGPSVRWVERRPGPSSDRTKASSGTYHTDTEAITSTMLMGSAYPLAPTHVSRLVSTPAPPSCPQSDLADGVIEQLFGGRVVSEQHVPGVLPVARYDHQLGQRRVGYGVDERQEVQPGVQHLGTRGLGRRLEAA
jgi:hypothetical protein